MNNQNIEKSSKESELAILRFISYNDSIKSLYQINKDWIYDLAYNEIFCIWKNKGFVDKFNTIDLFSKSDFYKESIIEEIYEYDFEVSEEDFITSVQLIEKKYKQRQIHSKLSQANKKVFLQSPEATGTELVMYMENVIKHRKYDDNGSAPDLKGSLIDLAYGHNASLNRLNLTTSNIWVVAGRPGHHKTNRGIDLGISYLNRCKELGLKNEKYGMFSLEISKLECKCRVWATILDIPLSDIMAGNYNKEEANYRMNTEFKHLRDGFMIFDINDCRTDEEIMSILLTHKFKVWCVDFIQHYAKMQKGNGTNEKVINAMSFFKMVTLLTDSLLILLAQCRKLDKMDKIKYPRKDDIEWAGDIEQYANTISLIFFPYVVNPDHPNFSIVKRKIFEMTDRPWFGICNAKVRNGEIFNQILWANAHKSQFVKWPDNRKPAPSEYFDW